MTTGWLQMSRCWGWRGRVPTLFILWAHLWRRARRCRWRWTGRGGSTTCSNTRVTKTKWPNVIMCLLCSPFSPLINVSLPLLSGQHLITALADSFFGYKTTSWYVITEQISYSRAMGKNAGLWVYLWDVVSVCLFVSRELGRQRSTIELDTTSVKPAQLQALEEAVNEKIRAHVPVTVQLFDINDPYVEKVHILILC